MIGNDYISHCWLMRDLDIVNLLFKAMIGAYLILNQVCAGHRPACACFLKIVSVWMSVYVCLCICVCVSVCVSALEAFNN